MTAGSHNTLLYLHTFKDAMQLQLLQSLATHMHTELTAILLQLHQHSLLAEDSHSRMDDARSSLAMATLLCHTRP
jgi:hypothetical protein